MFRFGPFRMVIRGMGADMLVRRRSMMAGTVKARIIIGHFWKHPIVVAGCPGHAYLSGMQTMLALSINGESRRVAAPLSVGGLVDLLGLDLRKVAIERNREIVPRSCYPQTMLANGDALEIVHFIGGG